MRLKNQVTNVILSNTLHALNFRKPSQFYREWTGAKEDEISMWEAEDGDVCLDNVNCYTLAELLEYAPASTSLLKRTHSMGLGLPRYFAETFDHFRDTNWSENPADALAKLVIYLIEIRVIKL